MANGPFCENRSGIIAKSCLDQGIGTAVRRCNESKFEINAMHFFYKLIPPRPDFHLTLDEIERATMNEHKTYWEGLFGKRKVIVYGPVFDPNGVYGMAVVDAEDIEEATSIKNNDPAVASGICTANLFEMQVGLVR